MTAPSEGEGYNVADAFVQMIPSFRGFIELVTREMTRAGDVGGHAFAQRWNDVVRRETNVPIGPSENQSRQQGERAGRTFADTFKARVTAALRSLPDVEVDADSSPAEVKLAELRRELEELSRKTVGVDIDSAAAVAQVDRIKAQLDELARKSPDVAVRADTTAAAARLEEIQQQVRDLDGETATVDVDDRGSVDNTERKLGGLAQLLISLAAPVGAAIAAGLAGALETVGALAAGVGALVLGFSGVGDAVKLLGQRQQQSAAAAAQAANAANASAQRQASAADQVRSAEQGLADARRNAAHQAVTSAEQVARAQQTVADAVRKQAQDEIASDRAVAQARQSLGDTLRQVAEQRRQADEQVATAEYSYRQAVQAVQDAEQSLAAARQQAQRDLENYANAQADSQLAARQAALDLQTAQANYNTVMASSTATEQQREQAQLDLARAQQAVVEANEAAKNATQDNQKAQKDGVNGAPAVVSAARQLADARYAQAVAARQLADAERNQAAVERQTAEQIQQAEQTLADARHARAEQQRADAEAVSNAEQQLRDAIRQQSWQQQQSAEQVARAQQQVATAMRDVRYASEQAGTATNTTLSNVNSQLAALSPATLAFARYWRQTWGPIVSQIKAVASAGLLPGVQKGLDALRPMLPTIERFVGAVSSVLGRIATQMGRALNTPFWRQFVQFMTRNVGPILEDFARLVGNVAKGLAGLAEAFGPITRTIDRVLVDWSRGFAQFGAAAKHSAWFQSFIAYVRKYAPAVMDFFGNLFKIVGKLLVGLAPLGGLMITVLDDLSKFLAKLSPDQLLMIAAAIGAIFAYFGGPLAGVVAGAVAGAALIVDNWSKIKPAMQPLLDWLQELWHYITKTVVPVLKGAFLDAWHGVEKAVQIVTRAYRGHKQQIDDVLHAIGALINFIVTKVIPVMGKIWKASFIALGYVIKGFIATLAAVVDAIKWMRDTALTIGRWFAGPFASFFQQAGHDIKNWFFDAWHAIDGVFNDLKRAALAVGHWFSGPFVGFFKRAGHDITQWGRDFVQGMKDIWHGLEHALAIPINWVGRYVINDGLIKAWDWITNHVPGMGSLSIDPIPQPLIHAATGAVLPGYAPGVDSVPAMLSPGEAVLMPQVTRWLGADTIHGWNAAAAGGRLGFATGGIVPGGHAGPGAVGSIVGGGGFLSGLSGLLSGAAGLLNDLNPLHWYHWLKDKFEGVLHLMDPLKSTAVGRIIAGVPGGLAKGLLDTALNGLKGLLGMGSQTTSGHGHVGPVGNHLQLIREALAAAGVPDTVDNEDAVNIIVSNESGWNPTAVNRTDSNWLAGHPSVGLMQTIGSTFQSWVTAALRNIGPFAYGVSENPIANLVAGIRYAFGTYGSLDNVPGVLAVRSGGSYVGYDDGGLLQPGFTPVWNGTGKAELVVPPNATFDDVVNGAGGVAAFEGDLYLDSGEFLGHVRGAANQVVDKRVAGARHAADQQVPGGVLGALASPHARAVSGAR